MLDAIKKLFKTIGRLISYLLLIAFYIAFFCVTVYLNLDSCTNDQRDEEYTEEEIEDMQEEYEFNRYRHP